MDFPTVFYKILCLTSGVLAAILLSISALYITDVLQVVKDEYELYKYCDLNRPVLQNNSNDIEILKNYTSTCNNETAAILREKYIDTNILYLRMGAVGAAALMAGVQILFVLILICRTGIHKICYGAGHGVFGVVYFIVEAVLLSSKPDFSNPKRKHFTSESKNYLSGAELGLVGISFIFCLASTIVVCMFRGVAAQPARQSERPTPEPERNKQAKGI